MIGNLTSPQSSLSPRSGAVLACLSGVIGAGALPPYAYWPLMVFPLSAFAIVLMRNTAWPVFVLHAFLIGFGYFVAGLWWLGVAFLVEPDQFAWALPLGVLGLPAVLALFPLAGMIVARWLCRLHISLWLALIVGLGGAELLRSVVLTGFPWNSFGMAFASQTQLMQSASLVGQNGLDLLVIAILSSPAFFIVGRRKSPIFLSACLLIMLFAFGAWRLNDADHDMQPRVRLRIMQPNVPLDAQFSAENAAEIMQSYLALSTKGSYPSLAGMATITHVIWPETAFPFLIDESPEGRAQLATIVPENGALITGAVRRDVRSSGTSHFFNSILVFDHHSAVLSHADKVHLVPFGEYLPFADVLEKLGIRQFVHAPGGFQAGQRRALLTAPDLPPFGPLICYEAIFSGAVLPDSEQRPQLLLNVTNDAWFGLTPGPSQHFALARLRAIEEGLPLVRAANSGISAVIDPYGRSLAQLGLGETGVIDSDLPKPIAPPLFSRFHFIGWYLVGLIGIIERLQKMTQRQLTKNSA